MTTIKDTSPPKFCAAPGCQLEIGHQYLMCAPHWRLVPKGLQTAVYRGLRGYDNAPDRNCRLMALRRYRNAVEAAIASLTPAPSTTAKDQA